MAAIISVQTLYNVRVGESAILNVYAAADPSIRSGEIRWINPSGTLITTDDRRVTFLNLGRQLIIRQATISDSGIYEVDIYRKVTTVVSQVLARTVMEVNVQGNQHYSGA